jgi:hypothetical integral membrane protein (TIGR02206 family)
MRHEHYVITMGSDLWWGGFIGSLLLFGALIYLGVRLKAVGLEHRYRMALVGIFVIRDIFLHAFIIQAGLFTWQESLPLHLCGISYIVGTVFLFRPKPILFEYLLMLSLAGALQAILTPELTHGFSDYFYTDYYFSHAAIIFCPMYGIFVLGFKPRIYSWAKIILWGHITLITVGIINVFLGSNYIYLMEAPKVDNPMILRPYPMHLLGFELFGCLHIIVIYLIAKKLIKKPELNPIT